MSLPVTEFVYFKLKPSVKPEDPTNEEGQQFIKTLQATKNQLGYESSAWGRTLEDDSVIVWAIGLLISIHIYTYTHPTIPSYAY